ncbi:MAG: hypothetical protein ACJAXZ_003390 [Akkermansiaceae bacterium]
MPGIAPAAPVIVTDPESSIESPIASVTAEKLPTMVSASASVVMGEFVAALPPEKPVSPLVATQFVTGDPLASAVIATRRAEVRGNFMMNSGLVRDFANPEKVALA